MPVEPQARQILDKSPTETDRPQPFQVSRPASPQRDSMRVTPPPQPAAGVPVRERRLSSTPSAGSAANEVGAPSVWTTPDWASHPVIESFYGHARRARENSFFEVMQSPTNTQATRTLAESCNSYGHHGSDDDTDDGVDVGHGHGEDGVHNGGRRRGTPPLPPAQKLGSFSFSYTTETSDELVGASPSFSTSSADSAYGHVATIGSIATVSVTRGDRRSRTAGLRLAAHGGYAHWNRQRLPTDLVPVPHHGRLKQPAMEAAHNQATEPHIETYGTENPQGGHADSPSPSSQGDAGHNPESPSRERTSGRLRTKLQDCRLEIDDRIAIEVALARDAHACLKRSTKAAANPKPSIMWSLLCGANTSSSGYWRNSSAAGTFCDGIELLHERLTVALHHRALNQLQRHRRHVNGILQIVTSHNPDLGLTEKQLDSFESAVAMLANDVKYGTLLRQVRSLETNRKKRVDARRHATIQHGRDCFESPRAKSAMLAKLLEAVSWYRLVQTNSREESASTTVGLKADHTGTSAGTGLGASDGPAHEPQIASGSSGSSSKSALTTSRSLQELQVERILSVLAGEEFYSDYSELMCQSDWWDIAQAHFENLIFAQPQSRVCQWVLRVSNDVAAVSAEPLEEDALFRLDEKKAGGHTSSSGAAGAFLSMAAARATAEWTKDPQPEQILEFVDRVTRRIRKEFEVPNDVTKSLNVFVQRMVFPRLALLCFNHKTLVDCQRKDKLWRKQCLDLSGLPLENLNVSLDLAGKIRSKLPYRRVSGGRKAFLIRAIDAFNGMTSIVPCDLLEELMYGVVVLHHEAALVLGTTQFSVETFFPLLTYVLLHCQLPTIHAQLHVLENYAVTHANANGEEAYYVYCVHAAVEYVCNTSALSTAAPATVTTKASDELPTEVPDPDGLLASAPVVPAV